MMYDDETKPDIPTIRIRAIGDEHILSINIPTGATLLIDDVEII